MLERKKIAAFTAGLLLCAYAAAPALNAFADEPAATTQTATEKAEDLTEDDDDISDNDEDADDTYIKSGDFMYSLTHDGTVCIESCSSTAAVLMVPDTLDGIAVTELGEKAFGSDPYATPFTEILLPASINYISDNNPFVYCTQLKSISVDAENKDFCTEDGILYSKSKDKLICYPPMKGGNTFTVPDTVRTIGTSAMYNTGLIEVNLPKGLENISFFALAGLTRILSIDLSQTKITEIHPYAFSGCTALNEVKLPDDLTYIGGGAFSGCTALKDITLPDALVEIGQYAFVNTGLTAIVIPDNVAEIGYCAFGYHSNEYENMVADDSFTLVGKMNSAAQRYATDSDSEYDYKNNFTFVTPEEYRQIQDYLNLERKKSGDYEYGIIDGGAALTCCYSDESGVLTVPDEIDGNKITKIYPSCFTIVKASEIVIPDSVEELREMAFLNCTGLKKITLPANVKFIGDQAFDGCTALEEIEICGAETIGNRVFCDCTALKTVKISGSIKDWNDDEPFIFCTALEDINISGDGIYCTDNGIMYSSDKTVIAAYPAAKQGRSFTASPDVTEIKQSAFANSKYLESVKLPNVKIINPYAFESCLKLKSIDVSDSLRKLDTDALYDCKELKSLRLPKSLTEIGECAFGYCYHESADSENSDVADELVKGFTLYAPKDSEAYKFAKEAGIKVVTGTTKLFGKNISSAFVYSVLGLLIAALIAVVSAFVGKKIKSRTSGKPSSTKSDNDDNDEEEENTAEDEDDEEDKNSDEDDE